MSACLECGAAQCTKHRRVAVYTEPCPQCGATVGHRQVELPSYDTPGMPPSGAFIPCPLGLYVASRAELARVEEKARQWEIGGRAAEEEISRLSQRIIQQQSEITAFFKLAIHRRNRLNRERELRAGFCSNLRKRVSVLASVLSGVVVERDRMLTNLTSCQARCTDLLEEVRALRIASDWKKGLKNGPQSALDILGTDRDHWKKKALEGKAAEKREAVLRECLLLLASLGLGEGITSRMKEALVYKGDT